MLGILDKVKAFGNSPDGRANRVSITPMGIYIKFIVLDTVFKNMLINLNKRVEYCEPF